MKMTKLATLFLTATLSLASGAALAPIAERKPIMARQTPQLMRVRLPRTPVKMSHQITSTITG